jgi:hypothetical protein
MDENGQIYFGSPDQIPEADKQRLEQARLREAVDHYAADLRQLGYEIDAKTFELLGIPGHDDWRALNELLAEVPLTITHGEDDGQPLPDMSGVTLHHMPVEEDDEELVVADGPGIHGSPRCHHPTRARGSRSPIGWVDVRTTSPQSERSIMADETSSTPRAEEQQGGAQATPDTAATQQPQDPAAGLANQQGKTAEQSQAAEQPRADQQSG